MGRKNTKRTAKSTADTHQSGGATATTLRPAGAKTGQATSSPQPAPAGRNVTVTHEQTSQRAREIWIKKGCKPGEDEQNWLEAETQLKAEAARR